MAYTKKTWVKGSTPLSAENFNHMEQGIADAHTEITQLNSEIAGSKQCGASYQGSYFYPETFSSSGNKIGKIFVFCSAFIDPPCSVNQSPALFKASGVCQLRRPGRLVRKSVWIAEQCKVVKIIFLKANLFITGVRALRLKPIPICYRCRIHCQRRLRIIRSMKAQSTFQKP